MSLRIDLTLLRMNCRSIGLPLGRLNEQAQRRGPLSCASCSAALIAQARGHPVTKPDLFFTHLHDNRESLQCFAQQSV